MTRVQRAALLVGVILMFQQRVIHHQLTDIEMLMRFWWFYLMIMVGLLFLFRHPRPK